MIAGGLHRAVTAPRTFGILPRRFDTPFYGNYVSSPRAIYYNGKTYLGWVEPSGAIRVAQYTHSTKALSTPVTLATLTSSDGVIHNSPSILVRDSDKKIMVAVSQDEFPTGVTEVFVSTSAEDATAFGAATVIDNTQWDPSYPILLQLPSVANDPIYYFVRWYDTGASTFYTGYYLSTDGGANWSAFQKVWQPVSTNAQYHTIIGDGASRIDFFVTTTNRAPATPSAVYHAYFDGSSGNLYKSDGTLIGAITAGPYSATSGTLVQDTSLGSARTDSAGYSAGKPHAVVLVNDGNTSTDVLVRCARWTGSAWQVNAVTNAGGIAGSWFQSSGAIDWSDPNVIWTPKKVGSYFEMHRYVSSDSGSTWAGAQLTLGSMRDNLMPIAPVNAAAGMQAVWGNGTYLTDANYYLNLMAQA